MCTNLAILGAPHCIYIYTHHIPTQDPPLLDGWKPSCFAVRAVEGLTPPAPRDAPILHLEVVDFCDRFVRLAIITPLITISWQ